MLIILNESKNQKPAMLVSARHAGFYDPRRRRHRRLRIDGDSALFEV